MSENTKKEAILSEEDVKIILLAIVAGHPEGIEEPKLLDLAQKVEKQIAKVVIEYELWKLVKAKKLVISGATDDDITFRDTLSIQPVEEGGEG